MNVEIKFDSKNQWSKGCVIGRSFLFLWFDLWLVVDDGRAAEGRTSNVYHQLKVVGLYQNVLRTTALMYLLVDIHIEPT